jgi:hypothetical protein
MAVRMADARPRRKPSPRPQPEITGRLDATDDPDTAVFLERRSLTEAERIANVVALRRQRAETPVHGEARMRAELTRAFRAGEVDWYLWRVPDSDVADSIKANGAHLSLRERSSLIYGVRFVRDQARRVGRIPALGATTTKPPDKAEAEGELSSQAEDQKGKAKGGRPAKSQKKEALDYYDTLRRNGVRNAVTATARAFPPLSPQTLSRWIRERKRERERERNAQN